MAVYKIFPEKDAFILSQYPAQNTGRDEILEVSNENGINVNSSAQGDLPAVKRSLIQFNSSDISNVITNKIGNASFQSNLNLYLATAGNLPLNYTIEAYPVTQSWNMGTGRVSDSPKTEDGVSWTWRLESGSGAWANEGGDWYTASVSSSQTFTYTSDKDISLDITSMVQLWNSSSIANNGVIVKLDDSIEFSASYVETSFFSVDTHTIYPPDLEFKWDDSTYSTTLTQVTSSDFIAKVVNLKSEFEDTNIYKFKVKSRDTFPTRAFQTSSVYLNAKVLPTSSYWGLKDIKTGEMVVDFDTNYTKISADNESNYFTVYMDGLEPERYYQIAIKTVVGDETLVIEDKTNYFKVVR
jgi:hypothetical protein